MIRPVFGSIVLGLVLLLLNFNSHAQNLETPKYTASNKGKIFFSWGGNRVNYSKSDIRFKGNNYDFTIKDATAKDKPKGWHADYINPANMTIPQTNAKIGYFISDNYTISLGVDHMKYVMIRNKQRTVDGYINLPDTDPGSLYNGTYSNDDFFVSEDFLKFEHTDGLNYIYAEVARYDDLSSLFGIRNTDIFQINITEGLAAGALLPKTNATLLEKERHDDFHLSGYGISAHAGLNLTFLKYFFIQLDLKGGFINMPNIRTTQSVSDSASQHFFYLQRVVAFGGMFRL